MNCANNACAAPIDPATPKKAMAREVVGYSVLREQGGQNHVLDRRETGRLLCPECTLRLRYGHPNQESLL